MDSLEVEESLELEYDMWDGQFDFVGPQEPTAGLRERVTSDGSLTEDLFTGGPLTPHLTNGLNGGKKTAAHQWCDNLSDQCNARNFAAVKFVTKASQCREIGTRRRKTKDLGAWSVPAQYIIRSHIQSG
ncbi:hypothetical protein EVAR_36490_1 [Eumeta japonica]|uniref:Uncharacterized protein n=1 Tax=Eumeta variegata TaxID=151549 RepID=A0A4C1WW32_EUMVA|nr:hypothetical protein EVAR_36490_1 [Eumeta japonica]